MQGLSLAGRDLKIAFTTSFADDLQEAAEHLTRFITRAGDLWDQINRPDERPPEERVPRQDWADLVLTGGSGLLNGGDDRRLGDYTGEIGRFAQTQVDAVEIPRR